jgi:hypothetical protein
MFWNRKIGRQSCQWPVSDTPETDAEALSLLYINISLLDDVSKACWREQ